MGGAEEDPPRTLWPSPLLFLLDGAPRGQAGQVGSTGLVPGHPGAPQLGPTTSWSLSSLLCELIPQEWGSRREDMVVTDPEVSSHSRGPLAAPSCLGRVQGTC